VNVSGSLSISGIDYAGVVNDQKVRADFEYFVKQGIAQEAGSGVNASDVDLTLSEGSVIVDFTVRVLSGVGTDVVARTLSTSPLANTVGSLLKQSGAAAVASTGDVVVTFTGIKDAVTPTDAPTAAPTNVSVKDSAYDEAMRDQLDANASVDVGTGNAGPLVPYEAGGNVTNASAPGSEEDAGAEEDNATAAPVKGHVVAKASSSAESDECRPDSGAAGLTCCSAYTRTATRPGCRSDASWAEAKAACKAKGMELCSKASLQYGLGKGAGCPELDGIAMWTSEECVVSPLQVPPAPTPLPPAEGWVYVLPHNHSTARDRPEDTAFIYYQFEPLKVRGDEHAIEIAEIVMANNGWQVSTSGATVSTPSGATDGILLIDGNLSSVWIDMKLEPITIKLPEPASVDGFGFVTGNVSDRDPVRWKFRGSLDGFMWTTLQDQAEDYVAAVMRRELQGFVFGEQRPTSGAAEPPAPAPESTTGGPNASIYSESLLNKSWTPADNEVTEEAAQAARQAPMEAAEQAYQQAVGSGAGGVPETEQEKEDKKTDTALIATLSTFGGIALLLAGGVAAYCMYTRPRASAAEQRDVADPLLSARGV
jgi:hypothetical protein